MPTPLSQNPDILQGETVLVVTGNPPEHTEKYKEIIALIERRGARVVTLDHSIDQDAVTNPIPDKALKEGAAAVLVYYPHAIDNNPTHNRTMELAKKLQDRRIPLVVVDRCYTTQFVQIAIHREKDPKWRKNPDHQCNLAHALAEHGAVGLGCMASPEKVVSALADAVTPAAQRQPRGEGRGR